MRNKSHGEGPLGVLVVDDEALVRMNTAEMLREAGFEVEEAANSDEALELLDNDGQRTDVLITDIEMPGRVNGLGLAWRVSTERPRAVLLLISGVVEPSPGKLPPRARFLSKPVAPQRLLQTLEMALSEA
jgi:DNA-binding NtrC family response regulator